MCYMENAQIHDARVEVASEHFQLKHLSNTHHFFFFTTAAYQKDDTSLAKQNYLHGRFLLLQSIHLVKNMCLVLVMNTTPVTVKESHLFNSKYT